MRFIKLSTPVLITLLFVFISVPAAALSAPNFGGNNSADYQPPTGNPQNITTPTLQPNSSSLQKASGNQQTLTPVNNLQVVQTGAPKPAPKPPKSWLAIYYPVLIVGALTVAGIVYIVTRPDSPKPPVIEEPKPAIVPTPKKRSPKKKKKTTKKKKK